MLEFFVIFSKSGIVLFATVNQSLDGVIDGLVKHIFLEERIGQYQTDQLQIKYLMDNEFELIFVVGYQKFLQLCYVDKFLDKIHLAFRDKYSDFDLRRILNNSFNKQTRKLVAAATKAKTEPTGLFNDPSTGKLLKARKRLDFCDLLIDDGISVVDMTLEFANIYANCVKDLGSKKMASTTAMRSFQDSAKSKKTIASMIVDQNNKSTTNSTPAPAPATTEIMKPSTDLKPVVEPETNGIPIKPLVMGIKPKVMAKAPAKKAKKETNAQPAKKGKAARQWDLCGSNPEEFDFSKKPTSQEENTASLNKNIESAVSYENVETNLVMTDNETSEDEDENIDEEEQGVEVTASKSTFFGSILKTISFNKVLSEAELGPVLNQLREHLIKKNVASQIAEEICDNIGSKLKGVHVDTWGGTKQFIRKALSDAIERILNPSKNINILREVKSKPEKPYVIVLCGVNGVGKSTNLAKIANWLILNKIKVLVVAGDTFRAGAIEQLRTHVRALKAIHERPKGSVTWIELFEKGYNRDTSNIAREAINHAKLNNFECVIVDTAGRMQDNEPLMNQLAKLIKNNAPDLTLFVGEALVGNEAVDQLTKFNSSLIDNGCLLAESTRSAIDGIVLTKFDTIDDQVGAAISMTYVTGKPIVFVGVGQTYRDLKQLDAKAVTKALMR